MATPDCDRSRPVVLVVEDDPGVREGLGLILDERYDVLFADDGPPALQFLRTGRVDAVLLDLGLPSTHGFDVLAAIKKTAHNPPVVVVTITTATDVVVRTMKLGAFDYLTKPFRDEDVLAKVEEALSSSGVRAVADRLPLPRTATGSDRPRCLAVVGDLGTAGTLKLTLEPRVVIDVARDGVAALRTLGAAIPDCIVCDDDGWAAEGAALVRALRGRYAECRVAMLTNAPHERRGLESSGLLDALVPLRSGVGTAITRILALCSTERQAAYNYTEHVQGAMEYLRVRYAEDVSLDIVARAAGTSRSRLAEVFRVEVGVSLGEYITALRVEIAKLLLARGPVGLDEIASQSGFCDASHLSRVFRDHTGRRPGAYRRESMNRRSAKTG